MTELLSRSQPRAATVPRAVGFWVVAGTTAALLAASSAPSPLYSVYQQRFGFSALTLTLIFAVYVVALLGALLVGGRLSDHLGRRPVLAAALVLNTGAMALFLSADATGWLVAARLVQGVATGTAIATLGAYLLDLQPPGGGRLGSLLNSVSPTAGLAVGSVVTGVLVQYAPDPSQLVFWLLGGLFLALAAATAVLPEPVTPRAGTLASLRPQVSVPRAARGPFLRSAPLMIASWALGGLVLSIGGSVLATVFDVGSIAVIGIVLACLAGAGAVASLALRDVAPAPMARIGAATLVVGAVLVLAALAAGSLAFFVVAVVVAGGGFGVGFLGSLRALTQLAAPDERAGLLSSIYVVSYLGFSVPAVIAGFLIPHLGLLHTALFYAGFVAVVAAVTLVAELAATRRTR